MPTIPFGAASTAEQVLADVSLSGRRAVVTGASSGIGAETARVLTRAGAEVTLAVRDAAAGTATAAAIEAETGRAPLVALLDLADPASVDAFVTAWSGPLHILVNNAGVMATPERRTAAGWELQLATNHLGHFQLSLGLHDALATAGTDDATARVVTVSSVGHVNGEVRFDDPSFTRTPYDPWLAYAQSKTANVLFTVEAARRWAGDAITATALNPGRIASTGLIRHADPAAVPPASFDPAGSTGVSVKDIPQGAATSALLAGSPLVEGVTGVYFEDCRPAAPYTPGVRRGVADYALDPVKAERLWELSLRMLTEAGYRLG